MGRIAGFFSSVARLAPAWTFLLAGSALLAPLSPACAQSDDSNAQFWLKERALQQHSHSQRPQRELLYQRPTHLIRREKPVRGFTLQRPEPPGHGANQRPAEKRTPPPATSAGAPPASAATAPASAPSGRKPPQSGQPIAVAPARLFRVAVIGDSLAESLEVGLADINADRPNIVIVPRARENTGLAREDTFNWEQAAKDLAGDRRPVDMAIIMVGANDRQPIRTSSGAYDPLTPKWRQIYSERAAEVAKAFKDKKIPFLWVGAPIMRSASLSDTMLALNEIYKTSVEKEGGLYVDDWDLFSDDSGQYALYGPDVNGETARMRSNDGVHFTRAGARKLAQLVETEINRAMDGSRPQVDQPIAGVAPQVAPAKPLAPAVSEGASPQTALRRGGGDLRTLVPAPAAPIEPVIPTRPVVGPVVGLTTPVVAPDGQLVSRKLVQTSAEGESAERTLVQGTPIQPRAGRADDFHWPRE